MKKLLLIGLIITAISPCWGQLHETEVAQGILDQLYLAAGKFQYPKPTVVITANTKRIAAYLPRHNRIEVEEKAYHICRQMGADSLAALAFLLGHELTHSWQEELQQSMEPPHFLGDHAGPSTSRGENLERDADLRGLFTAYLAGYNTLDVFPVLIDHLYDAYQMRDKVLAGYPTFAVRRQTTSVALELAENLGALFQSTQWALLVGRSDIAIAGLLHILQYYQSKELYNNLGLAYLRAAMAYQAPPDKFAYPFEWDARNRLCNRQSRGDIILSDEDEQQRLGKLQLANHYFTMALSLAPSDKTARINQYSCLLLMQQPRQALNLIESHGSERSYSPAVQIVKGIAYALLGDPATAEKCWTNLGDNTDNRYKAIASCNRTVLNGTSEQMRQCLAQPALPTPILDALKNAPLHKMETSRRLTIYADSLVVFQYEKSRIGIQYTYSTEKGRLLSFQNLSTRHKPGSLQINKADFLLSGRDMWWHNAEAGALLALDEPGAITSLVRYYVHR